MPQESIESDLKKAAVAVRHAQDVRKNHARLTIKGSKQREDDLEIAAERVREAMKPIRSHLGRAPSDRSTDNREEILERVREASAALQKERRRIWKMRVRKDKK